MSHFKHVLSTKASDQIPVNKYVSEKTGLTVIIGNVEGPLLSGYFCLATEAHDDDGLPHTLEHLIFLGSKRYPYKGILDLLANRCMAHGTNAWTDTDHTCYTINTAGDAGMLTLLPIYLDHILHPTLTDEGFTTEVHHIDGDGDNSGVVYCEMQGRENTAGSRCDLKLLRAMYPNNGYSAETGGIMENLRVSTDNVKVRAYHKEFYRPENLTVILTGEIDAQDVFKALESVENDIVKNRKTDPPKDWVKPWQTVPPRPNYGEFTEKWPSDIEDCGEVYFGWRGPLLTEPDGIRSLTACALLLRYLCDTAAAPLQRCLVETEDALAGDVTYNLTENLATMIKIEINSVPIKKLIAARDEALKCLRTVCSGEEPIDMHRMKILLRKQLRESLASLESDPHHAIACRAIGDLLYSQNEKDFISRMNPQEDLHILLEKDQAFWLSVLQKYFTDDVVVVVGAPSVQMQDSMAAEEKKRIELQRETLGAEGLAQKAKELTSAMEFNERPPPPGTLAAVPVPGCDKLRCHRITVYSSDAASPPGFDLKEVPLYTRAHSLATNFVYINLIFDTSDIDESARKWLPLHLNGLAECAIRQGDKLVPHEKVISAVEQLTVMFSNEMGFNGGGGNFGVGSFGQFVKVETRCEPCDYEQVVTLLHGVLRRAEITRERLLVFAQRLINDVANARRHGHTMVYATLRDALYRKNSNRHYSSVLRQHAFLKQLIETLNKGGAEADAMVEEARSTFKSIFENAWLHIATDFDRYKIATLPWKGFARENEITPLPPKLYWDAELMTGSAPLSHSGFVVGCGGVESSFLLQYSPGPLGHSVEELAPLSLALNYFTQLEGPMWRLIRGSGLSYGYGVRAVPHESKLAFWLYRATNAPAAYARAKSIIAQYLVDGKFEEDLFASARSTAIFEVVEHEKSPADVVAQSLLNYLRRSTPAHNSSLVQALAVTSPAAAAAAARRWLPALFDPAHAQLAVVCHPTKVNEIKEAFHKINVKLDAFESIEATHYNR